MKNEFILCTGKYFEWNYMNKFILLKMSNLQVCIHTYAKAGSKTCPLPEKAVPNILIIYSFIHYV